MTDEPTYTLKASDPLAMGLLEIRTALRAHDVRYALKYFEHMVEKAAALPIAPAEELTGAREVAGDMLQWSFDNQEPKPVRLGDEAPSAGHNGGPKLTVVT